MLAQGLPVIPAGGAGNNSGINPSSSAALLCDALLPAYTPPFAASPMAAL